MDLQLKGRPCLVTGASVGIGNGVARLLAAEGARVAITARRTDLLEALADEIAANGAERPLVIPADITAADAPASILAAVTAGYGHLDVLINNAGASRPTPPIAPDDLWDEALMLNFTQARRLTQAFLPGMRERKFGRIVCLSGTMEPAGTNAATAGKAALQAWAKGLSRDIAVDNVTVNCVAPGRIHSEQIDQRLHPTEESRNAFIKGNIPAGYFGTPQDIGSLIVFLASPLARYVTGTVIEADGGMKRYAH
jgi:3-oxoacyl-[acyl-carrier protein] reductase